MKCGACKFDDDSVSEEDKFLSVKVASEPGGDLGTTANFPQRKAPALCVPVYLWACPMCGMLRIENWRIGGV